MATMTTATPRRTGTRVLAFVGVTLVIGGLSVLGWVAWQYWGTNVVSQRAHEHLRAEITSDWDAGQNSISGVGLLRVPRFGDDFEVPILDGDDPDTLARGVGRDVSGGKPGKVGNLVLSGHRVTHGEPFRDFPDLRAGDTVVVETRTHVYTYRLRQGGNAIRVPFTTAWPLWPVPDPAAEGEPATKAVVTLVTCSELFHTDDRSVVVGDLVDSVRKPGPDTGS